MIWKNIHLFLSSLHLDVLSYVSYMGFVSEARAFAPSKRVGSLLIMVAAAIVAVVIFRSEPSLSEEPSMRVTLSDTTTPRTETEEKDTDGDKLKDWEEDLWGLSSVSSDTDSDGIGDYQEVENRRKAVADAPALVLDTIDPDAAPPTPTELAGRILVSQFLTAKEAGVPLKDDSVALAGQIALSTADLDRVYPIISTTDLNIVDGTMSAKAYGNAIGTALMTTSNTPAPSEYAIMVEYIQTSDSEKFQKDMGVVIKNYDTTINNLITMSISADRASAHLALTNAVIAVRTDLVDLAKVGDNPLMAIAALDAYRKDSSLMTGLFEKLRASLKDSDAEFLPGDPGYIFVNAKTTQ